MDIEVVKIIAGVYFGLGVLATIVCVTLRMLSVKENPVVRPVKEVAFWLIFAVLWLPGLVMLLLEEEEYKRYRHPED